MFKIIALYVYTWHMIRLHHRVYEYAQRSSGSGTLYRHAY